MRAKPLGDAPVVATLKAGTTVTINARSGAWAQVRTADGSTGHVRLLNLRTGSGQKGDSGAGALASVFRTGSSGNTVATGVKGMSEEALAVAEPAPAEFARLDGFRAGEQQARSEAAAAGLRAQPVEWLAAPAQGKEERKKKKKKKGDKQEDTP